MEKFYSTFYSVHWIPKSCYLCKPLPQEAAETIIEETFIMMDKKTIAGYAAGIACGVSYGMNPLFAKHLLSAGVPVDTMLFLRYAIAALILGFWILLGKQRSALRLRPNQLELLALLGMLFAFSSLFLFDSYAFIPSGLATTIVFLYPVFTAIIMVFLKVYPSWQNWVAIAATFAGVVILSIPSGGVSLKWQGLLLAALSALAYSFYLVTVNRSRRLRSVPNMVLTFYALLFGSLLFLAHHVAKGGAFFAGIPGLEGAASGGIAALGAGNAAGGVTSVAVSSALGSGAAGAVAMSDAAAGAVAAGGAVGSTIADVNGNCECSIFGKIECSVFRNSSTSFSVTMMQHFL